MCDKLFPRLIPMISLLIGCYWLYASLTQYDFYDRSGPLTGFFPAIVGGLLILVSVLTIFSAPAQDKRDFHFTQFLPVAGIAGAALLGHLIGTTPAVFIFLLLWLKGFEKYSMHFALLASGITTLTIWLIFDVGVSIYFQPGILWTME
jgi:hypothetical protein